MKATLDEITTEVKLPRGTIESFSIKASRRSRFKAKAETPRRLPGLIAAQYARISLKSPGILAANDELRTHLELIGDVLPSHFWYELDSPNEETIFVIRDIDPVDHRVISIGSYSPGDFDENDSRLVAFVEAIAASKFCEQKPCWVNAELYVRIKPMYTCATNRLDTYRKVLELFR